jgi:LDH2 family malate/lactate/ureidoglycolate dehydrogenase
MTKSFLMLFSVISLAVASAANTFHVDLYQSTVVNGTTFKAGEAKVELQEGKAVLKQGKTTAEATIKMETNKDKYAHTMIGYKDGNEHKIKDICIGGTTNHILFE